MGTKKRQRPYTDTARRCGCVWVCTAAAWGVAGFSAAAPRSSLRSIGRGSREWRSQQGSLASARESSLSARDQQLQRQAGSLVGRGRSRQQRASRPSRVDSDQGDEEEKPRSPVVLSNWFDEVFVEDESVGREGEREEEAGRPLDSSASQGLTTTEYLELLSTRSQAAAVDDTTTTPATKSRIGGRHEAASRADGNSRDFACDYGRAEGEQEEVVEEEEEENEGEEEAEEEEEEDWHEGTPRRFQKLVSQLWKDINADNLLGYMGLVEQEQIKQALVLVSAYAALSDLPAFHMGVGTSSGRGGIGSALKKHSPGEGAADAGGDGGWVGIITTSSSSSMTVSGAVGGEGDIPVTTPQAAFRQMDSDGDGEVTFLEFSDWYRSRLAGEDGEKSKWPRAEEEEQEEKKEEQSDVYDKENSKETERGAEGKRYVARGSTGGEPMSLHEAVKRQQRQQEYRRQQRTVYPLSSSFYVSITTKDTASVPPKAAPAAPAGGAAMDGNAEGYENDVVESGSRESFNPNVLYPPEGEDDRLTGERTQKLRDAWLAGHASSRSLSGSAAEWKEGRGHTNAAAGGAGRGGSMWRGKKRKASSRTSAAADALDKSLTIVRILVRGHADHETIIAALSSGLMVSPEGQYDLDMIEHQFGKVIRGIVEGRNFLERICEPSSSERSRALKASAPNARAAALDLDDHHARILRDYLVQGSKDVRAVVVHMADLLFRMRSPLGHLLSQRQSLALEALQLYVPVSNALGLGARFRELEEMGYRTLFPESYDAIVSWHSSVWAQGHAMMESAKQRILEALDAHYPLQSVVLHYSIQGRTKGVVSTFRKVFRGNKRTDQVHDLWGLRIVITPAAGVPVPSPLGQEEGPGVGGYAVTSDDSVERAGHVTGGPAIDVTPEQESSAALKVDGEAAAAAAAAAAGRGGGAGGGEGGAATGVAPSSEPSAESVGAAPSSPGAGTFATSVDLGGGGRGDEWLMDVASSLYTEASTHGINRRHEKLVEGCLEVEESNSGAALLEGFKAQSPVDSDRLRAHSPVDSDSAVVHEVHRVLTSLYPTVPGRWKNYVDHPKPNGYRSVHDCCVHPCGLAFEVQIRTHSMHLEAEGGVAAHSLYKGGMSMESEADAELFRAKISVVAPPSRQLLAKSSRGSGGGGESQQNPRL